MMSTVSIVIPTHNRRDKLMRLLRDLDHQDYPGGNYEVIVVDDGSKDATKDGVLSLRTGYPLRYHRQECRGPAAARNAGIREATGDYVILLDDDMRVEPSLIRAHLDTHVRFKDAVVLGQAWLSPRLPDHPFVRYRRRLDRTFAPAAGQSSITRVPMVSSANTSVKRSLVAGVGLYCEEMRLPGSEEVELSWRLNQHDVPIVYNTAIRAFQDDTPVTFQAYCSKHERYGMAGAELVSKVPAVARDLSSVQALVQANGPIAWGEDPLAIVARKSLKILLSGRPSLAILRLLVALLERTLPVGLVLGPLYRLTIGLHIFRGFRAGLRTFQTLNKKMPLLSHNG